MNDELDEWGMSRPVVEQKEEESQKKKKNNVFDIMASSYDRKKPEATAEEIESISSYMFARYLSNNPIAVFWANELNLRGDTIPKYYQYKFVRLSFPKDKVKFIKYIKNEDIFDKDTIEIACLEFKCGKETAVKYLEMLPESEFNKLIKKYTIGGILKK